MIKVKTPCSEKIPFNIQKIQSSFNTPIFIKNKKCVCLFLVQITINGSGIALLFNSKRYKSH